MLSVYFYLCCLRIPSLLTTYPLCTVCVSSLCCLRIVSVLSAYPLCAVCVSPMYCLCIPLCCQRITSVLSVYPLCDVCVSPMCCLRIPFVPSAYPLSDVCLFSASSSHMVICFHPVVAASHFSILLIVLQADIPPSPNFTCKLSLRLRLVSFLVPFCVCLCLFPIPRVYVCWRFS